MSRFLEGPPIPQVLLSTMPSLLMARENLAALDFMKQHNETTPKLFVAFARRFEEMSIYKDEILEDAARLHDIGKGHPFIAGLLSIKDKLDNAQEYIMHLHPAVGRQILLNAGHEDIDPQVQVAYSHHENWDGTGYPQGLRGEEIPLIARVFSVVDAFDAMTHARPYRKGVYTSEQAFEELKKFRRTQFDPEVVKTFIENFSAIQKEL